MAPALRITSVDCDREQYRDLLLLADEQWDMVELYLHRGERMRRMSPSPRLIPRLCPIARSGA